MDTSMSQNSENDCQNNQANRDINITNNYGDSEDQEFINYKIISEIFDFLFKSNLPEIDSGNLENTNSLIHLKEKIPLNFPNDGEKDVEEMFTQLWNKKSLVEKYVKEENDDSEKIDGLILKFREYFIKLKKSKSHETEVEDISIFYQLANYCIPKEKIKDSCFLPNALAIVIYFFESCDFGKRTKSEKENNISLF